MSSATASRPLVHRLALPAGTSAVKGLFVNGVPLRPGADYEVRGGGVWIHRGVRPARELSRRDLMKIALCVEVVPEGDSIDAIVHRDGALTTVRLPCA